MGPGQVLGLETWGMQVGNGFRGCCWEARVSGWSRTQQSLPEKAGKGVGWEVREWVEGGPMTRKPWEVQQEGWKIARRMKQSRARVPGV